MKIVVVDAQGGGLGKGIIERLKSAFGSRVEICAVGTNVLATQQMLKGGADAGATGENAVVFNAGRADVIIGSIGIIAANAMLGELTPAMAAAIASSPAQKILIPYNKCHLMVAAPTEPLQNSMERMVHMVAQLLEKQGETL